VSLILGILTKIKYRKGDRQNDEIRQRGNQKKVGDVMKNLVTRMG